MSRATDRNVSQGIFQNKWGALTGHAFVRCVTDKDNIGFRADGEEDDEQHSKRQNACNKIWPVPVTTEKHNINSTFDKKMNGGGKRKRDKLCREGEFHQHHGDDKESHEANDQVKSAKLPAIGTHQSFAVAPVKDKENHYRNARIWVSIVKRKEKKRKKRVEANQFRGQRRIRTTQEFASS